MLWPSAGGCGDRRRSPCRSPMWSRCDPRNRDSSFAADPSRRHGAAGGCALAAPRARVRQRERNRVIDLVAPRPAAIDPPSSLDGAPAQSRSGPTCGDSLPIVWVRRDRVSRPASVSDVRCNRLGADTQAVAAPALAGQERDYAHRARTRTADRTPFFGPPVMRALVGFPVSSGERTPRVFGT